MAMDESLVIFKLLDAIVVEGDQSDGCVANSSRVYVSDRGKVPR